MIATAKVERLNQLDHIDGQIQAQVDALRSSRDAKIRERIFAELTMYVDQRQRLLAQMEKS